MEVSALTHAGGLAGTHARSPLLRLQSDERLIALIRRGNHHAFEALVGRYQARLLAFCRHMLNSREDAEDVLQEVFAAAFNAILADDRPINVRPWLYRIARNRSLNHLRKHTAIGVDSMDVHLSEHGLTTADKVHKREEFRQLMADVQDLAETQRTALLLREIDALSYEQIAEAMETTIPSVKSLLVRARVSLAEAAEARLLTCEEVRDELGEVAEGLRRTSPPVRRHLRTCERCQGFRKQLRQTNKAHGRAVPDRPAAPAQEDAARARRGAPPPGGGGAAAAGGGAAAAAGRGAPAPSPPRPSPGLAAAAIVTAGAVEVKHVKDRGGDNRAKAAQVAQAAPPVAAATRADRRARLRRTPRRSPRASPCPPPVEERDEARREAAREGRREAEGRGDRHADADAGPDRHAGARADPDARPDAGAGHRAAPGGRHRRRPRRRSSTRATPSLLPTEPEPGPAPEPVDSAAAAARRRSRRPSPRRPRTSAERAQWIRLPSGTSASGASRITRPSSSLAPRHSTSERTGPIWRGGKLTTATISRPSSSSRA